jgi:hypothetical protein
MVMRLPKSRATIAEPSAFSTVRRLTVIPSEIVTLVRRLAPIAVARRRPTIESMLAADVFTRKTAKRGSRRSAFETFTQPPR